MEQKEEIAPFKIGDLVQWKKGGQTNSPYIRDAIHTIIAVDHQGDIKVENDNDNWRYARFFELSKNTIIHNILKDL